MTAGMRAPRKSTGRPQVGGVGISSAQRVIDAASGVSKRELAEYYLGVTEWLLPQLMGAAAVVGACAGGPCRRNLLPAPLRAAEDAAHAPARPRARS